MALDTNRRGLKPDGAARGEWVYGRRPVMETLRAERRHIYEMCLAERSRSTPEVEELRTAAATRGVTVREAAREELESLAQGGHHQGVAMRVGGFPYIALDQVLHDVRTDAQAIVLALDHVEDPQNVGSLLRTADAAGVTAVILPEDRAAGVTPAVTRASAGASEYLRVARVVNLVRALGELKEAGAWVSGLDVGPDASAYTSVDLTGRTVLVVGSEGHGLGRLVRETCDRVLQIPMSGRVASLNAGVAGAVVLYEIVRQRRTVAAVKTVEHSRQILLD